MSRCRDKVDVIVTDSPLLLSAFYNKDPILGEDFNKVVNNVFQSYDNRNYLLTRTKPYNPKGRLQTEEESDQLTEPMIKLLTLYNVPVKTVTGDFRGYAEILKELLEGLSHGKEN